MNKIMKKIFVMLCIAFILPSVLNSISSIHNFPQAKAQTLEEAKLVETEGTMGVGGPPNVIVVENAKLGAEYVYTPANKKIISVSAHAGYGYIYASSVGKTTITVNEIYKGKTTKVGSYKINIVNAQINQKEKEIGLSSYNTITLNYTKEMATYQYKSSDVEVASVNEYGYIKGLKYGKATISVTETYKGKTIKIGTCAVTVIKSKLAVKELEVPIYEDAYDSVPLLCWNEKATYTYKSSDSKVVKIDKNGLFSGLKKGKATITVTETYKKVKRKLGSVTINVVLSSIDPNSKAVIVGVNSSTDFLDMIDEYYNTIPILNKNQYANHICESENSSIVSVEVDNSDWEPKLVVKGAGIGTTTLTVYEEYKGKKRIVGTIAIEVKEFPVTDFIFRLDDTNPEDTVTQTFTLGRDYSLKYSYGIRPINTTTPIIFTSSDETIATVDNKGGLIPIKVGTVEITATCGSFTDTMIVIIEAEE